MLLVLVPVLFCLYGMALYMVSLETLTCGWYNKRNEERTKSEARQQGKSK
jgi:hypothetical protein